MRYYLTCSMISIGKLLRAAGASHKYASLACVLVCNSNISKDQYRFSTSTEPTTTKHIPILNFNTNSTMFLKDIITIIEVVTLANRIGTAKASNCR